MYLDLIKFLEHKFKQFVVRRVCSRFARIVTSSSPKILKKHTKSA